MPVFKVTDASRATRRMVVANNLEELKTKSIEKLGLTDQIQVFTEKDGFLVDEDEILLEIKDQPLLMLQDGQSWKQLDASLCEPAAALLDVHQPTINPICETPQRNEDPEPATPHKSLLIPLPTFSLALLSALRKGELDGSKWRKVVTEAATFYLTFHADIMDNMSVYRIIGEKMFISYPCISREGTRPWSTFTKALSQRVRSERFAARQIKRKSQVDAGPAKKARAQEAIAQIIPSQPSLLSDADLEINLAELKKQWERPSKDVDIDHVRVLMRETFPRRSQWIATDVSVNKILDEYPGFEYGKFLMEEFNLKLEASGKKLDHLAKRLSLLLENVMETMPLSSLKSADHRIPSIINFIEKATGFYKGKGVKTEAIVQIMEDIEEDQLTRAMSSKEDAAPRLLVLIKDAQYEMAVVKCYGRVIYTQAADAAQALLVLLAVYYCFQLEYPKCYSQILGILQQTVIGDPYTGDKTTNYKHFISKC